MKRRVEESEACFLNEDIIGVIASQYQATCIGDLFKFQSISHSFSKAFPNTLKNWAIYLLAAKKKEDTKGRREEDMLKKYLIWDYNLDGIEKRFDDHQFLMALFDLHKYLMIKDFWLYDKDGSKRCHKYRRNSDQTLGTLFYYNEVTRTVIPMREMPGLEIVPITLQNHRLKSLISNLIRFSNNPPDVITLAINGLYKEESDEKLKALYYGINKLYGSTPLPSISPINISSATDAVIDGVHLFSNDNVFKNLYSCNRIKSSEHYPEYEKEFLILQYINRYERPEEILKRLNFPYVDFNPTSPQYDVEI